MAVMPMKAQSLAIAHKQESLRRVSGEVEDLAKSVAELKARFARQTSSVKLHYYWELESLRSRFLRFKRCVEALEEAGEEQAQEMESAADTAWNDVKHAADTLLMVLPAARVQHHSVPVRTRAV